MLRNYQQASVSVIAAEEFPERLRKFCTLKNVERLTAVSEYIDEIDAWSIVRGIPYYDGLSLAASAKVYLGDLDLVKRFTCLIGAMKAVAGGKSLLHEDRELLRSAATILLHVRKAAEHLSAELDSDGDVRSIRANILEPVQLALGELLALDQSAIKKWADCADQTLVGEWLDHFPRQPFPRTRPDGAKTLIKLVVDRLAEGGMLSCPPEEALLDAQDVVSQCIASAHLRSGGRPLG